MAKKKEETKENFGVVAEPRVSMGSDLLDLLVGGDKGVYGLPFGAILQLYGDSSTGKTFVKNEIIAATYWALKKLGIPFTWESDDCETGDTFDTSRMYGFDIHPSDRRIGTKVVHDSETIEEMDAKLSLMIQSIPAGAFGIYAVDSLDGLADATKKKKEAERLKKLESGDEVVDAGDYGAQIAKFLSQDFFRNKHRALEKAHILLVIVSQTRTNMGAGNYAPKRKTSNGDAMEFYCHTRILFKRVSDIVKNGKKVGVYVKATTTKSKTPRPYREVFYSAYFDYGIDNIGSNIDYLFDLRTADEGKLKKSAEAIAWSENAKSKSFDNLKQWLQDNNLMDACKADKKATTNSTALSAGWILDWVNGKDQSIKDSFDAYFGEEYTRDELIKLCEDNPEMNAELTRRVREKWEALEDAVATNRPSKYGT